MITAYHARYYANELICRCINDDRLSQSLFDAKVDLNPHQIEAALFALKNPLSEGIMLADEVGLGKTVEAGLVLCQLWAEKRRNLLVVCPAVLRKQWEIELVEKFALPCEVVDSNVLKNNQINHFKDYLKYHLGHKIIIVSPQYVSKEDKMFIAQQWDCVVLDEAHKYRNAYKANNKLGKIIKDTFSSCRKLLLTATPLQNSLMELYGLGTLLDPIVFSDSKQFQRDFVRKKNIAGLKQCLHGLVKRTLRKQVLEYIRYTERKTLTQEFSPTDQEHFLYQQISDFLHQESHYALPKQHKHLTGLILRKLLASSPYAVLGTLEQIHSRLLKLKQNGVLNKQQLVFEYDEYEVFEEDNQSEEELIIEMDEPVKADILQQEIIQIENFIQLAKTLAFDSKTQALLTALDTGFQEMSKFNAPQKVIIFTESVRTQEYLYQFLIENGYDTQQVVMFNGKNTHQQCLVIYEKWKQQQCENPQKFTGSIEVDRRTALIDYFHNHAKIMIATEAASEGVNLQFCSLIINYDLPWNPQRIEQRIGRCHRYGQKFDVVVINFLNTRNLADKRVLELLTDKFNLFNGVFGASDEVLGQLEQGIDIEQAITNIYKTCRTEQEIQNAFDQLQQIYETKIENTLRNTREKIMNHFDEDVLERLKVNMQDRLGRMEHWFWKLTYFVLQKYAIFNHEKFYFYLNQSPNINLITQGRYVLLKRAGEITGVPYRLNHPLGEWCIQQALNVETPNAEIQFDTQSYSIKISLLEKYRGKSGWLCLDKITIHSQVEIQELLVFTVCDDQGNWLDDEFCRKLFLLDGEVISYSQAIPAELSSKSNNNIQNTITNAKNVCDEKLKQESSRINLWADAQTRSLEDHIDELKQKKKQKNKECEQTSDANELIKLQEDLSTITKQLRQARNKLADMEDDIEEQRQVFIQQARNKLMQSSKVERLFSLKWKLH